MPEKSHAMNTKQKDMEKLRPETTLNFTRNLTSFTGTKTVITLTVLLSLMTSLSMVSGEKADECASNPCQHGGTCIEYQGGFFCECTDGYYGIFCENIRFYLVRDELSKIRFDCDFIDTLPTESPEACATIAGQVTGVDAADYDATIGRCELQHCGSNIALSYTNNDNFLLIRADIFPSDCVSRTIAVNNKPPGFVAECFPQEDAGQSDTLEDCKAAVCAVGWDVGNYRPTDGHCMRKRCDPIIEWAYWGPGYTTVVTLKITGT